MKYFEIYKGADHMWRWRFADDGNHEKIASGEGYQNRSDCFDAIEMVKSSAHVGIFQKNDKGEFETARRTLIN